MDQLRKRIPELDADSEYVVYSNSGPRSKAAAFLLRERNIKVKSLIGGIRNWQYETFVRFKKKFEETFGEWVAKHRWWIIIAAILAVLGLAWGMRFLTFNNDNRIFFSEKIAQGHSRYADRVGVARLRHLILGGAVAQLGERVTGSHEVRGSNPLSSTI